MAAYLPVNGRNALVTNLSPFTYRVTVNNVAGDKNGKKGKLGKEKLFKKQQLNFFFPFFPSSLSQKVFAKLTSRLFLASRTVGFFRIGEFSRKCLFFKGFSYFFFPSFSRHENALLFNNLRALNILQPLPIGGIHHGRR